MDTPAYTALSAWYGSRPTIRRLLAVWETPGLRVLVHVERAFDSNEVHPTWIANRDVWIEQLESCTGSRVRLEHSDDPFGGEALIEAPGVVIAALSWRDPPFS